MVSCKINTLENKKYTTAEQFIPCPHIGPVNPCLQMHSPVKGSQSASFSHVHCWEQFNPNVPFGHTRRHDFNDNLYSLCIETRKEASEFWDPH